MSLFLSPIDSVTIALRRTGGTRRRCRLVMFSSSCSSPLLLFSILDYSRIESNPSHISLNDDLISLTIGIASRKLIFSACSILSTGAIVPRSLFIKTSINLNSGFAIVRMIPIHKAMSSLSKYFFFLS